MAGFPKHLYNKLAARETEFSLRTLRLPGDLIDFSSNDYLGFARNGAADESSTAETPLQKGATGSRLITGNHHWYTLAEEAIAQYHQVASALIYNSGYDANLGFFGCVPQRGDVVLFDELAHASIRDGIQLSAAKAYKFRHNDNGHLQELLGRFRDAADEIYVVTESVFSMDGDTPELEEMAALCRTFGAHLVVDEAHALGVFGGGLVRPDHEAFATIVTFGKALGAHGAAILGSCDLRTYLINYSRSLIYTTALPPHSVAAIHAGYERLSKSESEVRGLHRNISYFQKHAREIHPGSVPESHSAIQTVLVPGNRQAVSAAETLRRAGLDVRAILSPTVPQGKERLRICLHSFNTEEELKKLLTSLRDVFA